MGVVFKARDTRLNRTVVIKALHPDKACDADPRRRFFQEAQAASALNHPNIVTVYDIGSENGIDFIVMEYVKGSPLDTVLLGGPLKPELAVKYGTQIADALLAAHESGIIHRDLKPGNVVITSHGAVKLLDFGLAKVTDKATAISSTSKLRRPSPPKGVSWARPRTWRRSRRLGNPSIHVPICLVSEPCCMRCLRAAARLKATPRFRHSPLFFGTNLRIFAS